MADDETIFSRFPMTVTFYSFVPFTRVGFPEYFHHLLGHPLALHALLFQCNECMENPGPLEPVK